MICGTCQREIAEKSNFCYYCGARQQAAAAAPAAAYTETGARRLRRSPSDKVFGGVCGGLGEYFDIDPVILRVIWAVLAISGIGILAYIICWLVIDEGPVAAPAVAAAPIVAPAAGTKRLRRSASDAKWAGVCGGIAAHMGVDSTAVRLIWVILSIIPGSIIGGLIAYFIAWLVMPPPEPASATSNQPFAHSS